MGPLAGDTSQSGVGKPHPGVLEILGAIHSREHSGEGLKDP